VTSLRHRTAGLLLAIALLGCGAIRGSTGATIPTGTLSPSGPEDAIAAICGADRLQTVRARFRANVDVAGQRSAVEGILLVRRPGALRVKFFGIAGITVHDAIWVGDGARVRGRVAGIERQSPLVLVQTPERPVEQPEARFSLLLWSLWQPRCARPPEPVAGEPGRFALDAAPAQARSREVSLVDGAVVSDALVTADGERVVARSSGYERHLGVPLPRQIEIGLPSAGWTATVEVSEYDLNEALDEALFALPADEAS